MPIKPIDVTLQGHDETKPAFDSAHKHAESFGAKLKETLNAPFEFLKGLLAVEMVNIIGEFFKGSVEAAAESEAAWVRVAQAVENAGISFGGVRDELKETFEQISERTRFSQKEVSDAFATVLNVSNDYKGSVKNIGLITDIAIAKQIDLSTAATIVGKAMDGQTSLLKRYGIIIADGANAMDELNKRFRGFADRDGASLQGRLHQVANEWEEVQVKVGLAITGSDAAAKSTDGLVTTLEHLAGWLEKNTENIRDFVDGLGMIGGALAKLGKYTLGDHGVMGFVGTVVSGYQQLGTLAGQAIYGDGEDAAGEASDAAARERQRKKDHEKAEEQIAANARAAAAEKKKRDDAEAEKAAAKALTALKEELSLLADARDLTGLSTKDYERLGELQFKLAQLAKDTNLPLKERVAIEKELKKFSDEDQKRAAEQFKEAEKIAEFEKKGGSLNDIRSGGKARVTQSLAPIVVSGLHASELPTETGASFTGQFVHTESQAAAGLKGLETSFDSLGKTMRNVTDGALVDFFGAWQTGIADVIAGHQSLGQAIVSSARKGVGGAMAAEGQATMLKAAAAAVEGLTNPVKFLQAGKLFAVGTAELALAATLQGGGGGGGSSYGGGVSAAGFSPSQGSAGSQGKVTVVLPGKKTIIDTTNPDDLNALRDAIQSLVGTRELEFLVGGS